MNHKQTVIIIEDEKNISGFIETTLAAADYKTLTAGTGADGLSLIASQCPDIVLLDLGLPDLDGLEVLEKLRQFSKVPVIIISARTQEQGKIKALDSGADDYITKPFGIGELLARIRTALRHSLGADASSSTVYHAGELTIDFERRLVKLREEVISLTQIEYKIVSILARHPGRVLTYDYLMKEIWGPYTDNNNQILRVNMAHIRRKLESNTAEPEYIFTEIGVGYRMLEP